jgi:hypothetical protein
MTVASIWLFVSTLYQVPLCHRQENDIRTDAILAKEFKWLVRRRCAVMGEGIDALLPLCDVKKLAMSRLLGREDPHPTCRQAIAHAPTIPTFASRPECAQRPPGSRSRN